MRFLPRPRSRSKHIFSFGGSRLLEWQGSASRWLGPGPTKARPHHVCRNCRPRSGGPFGGGIAPGAEAGGADGADLEPVLRAAGQAGDGAARGFADVALRAGSAGREGLLGDVGLDAAPEGVPGEVRGAFESPPVATRLAGCGSWPTGARSACKSQPPLWRVAPSVVRASAPTAKARAAASVVARWLSRPGSERFMPGSERSFFTAPLRAHGQAQGKW